MTTLPEFLLARIEEHEAVARAATPGPWTLYDRGVGWEIEELPEPHDGLTFYKADAFHVARHDPAAVLAQCQAVRAIVKSHESAEQARANFVAAGNSAGIVAAGMATGLRIAMQLLASLHSEHPDYEPEWGNL